MGTATFGRGLARTRFSNFALICLAMSCWPKLGSCGDAKAIGAHTRFAWPSDVGRRGCGACRTGAREALAGAASGSDLEGITQQLTPGRSFNKCFLPSKVDKSVAVLSVNNLPVPFAKESKPVAVCCGQLRSCSCVGSIRWRLSKYTAVFQKVRSSRRKNQTVHGSNSVPVRYVKPFKVTRP